MTNPDEFEAKQIFIAHPRIWEHMELWARNHNFYLSRIPDGATEDGIPFLKDPKTDPNFTPTYAFMPKMAGD